MSKSCRAAKISIKSASKRFAVFALSALIAVGPYAPGFAEEAKSPTDAAATSSTDATGSATGGSPAGIAPAAVGTTPESDPRGASDTVWSVNSKVEKKMEQDLQNPQVPAEKPNTTQSMIDAINKTLEEQKKTGGTPASGSTTGTGSSGVTPANPLMPTSGESPRNSQIKIESPSTPQTSTAPMPKPAPHETSGGSAKLFGRIEQLSGEGDVKLPALQALTPKLDPRGKLLAGELEKYSGTIAKSFPSDWRGTWGGSLAVWSYRYSPAYLQVDRAEAINTANILKVGRSGQTNFQFYRNSRNNQIALEPAKVLLSIPMKDSYTFGKMMGGAGGMNSQMGPFAGNFNQMVGNMEAPIVTLYFGNAATNGMETGVSGNEFRQTVVKNVIRELGPGVIEQQIVTKFVSNVAGTGRQNTGYEEAVMRFKKLSESKLYVLAASVKYSGTGKYLSKLIMYGTVDRGHVVQTNPMGDMNKMMGQMMNLGNMQNMLGGGGSGRVNVPPGGFPMPTMPGGAGGTIPGFNDIMKQMQQLQH